MLRGAVFLWTQCRYVTYTYVASGPDCMPSLRLYEGDFGVLLAMLRGMGDQLTMCGSAITALARDVSALEATWVV